eukprot:jgi/Botrbrau1/17283/Bobra.0015s0040.1
MFPHPLIPLDTRRSPSTPADPLNKHSIQGKHHIACILLYNLKLEETQLQLRVKLQAIATSLATSALQRCSSQTALQKTISRNSVRALAKKPAWISQ